MSKNFLVLLTLSLSVLTTAQAQAEELKKTYDATKIKSLNIINDIGDTKIETIADSKEISITAKLQHWSKDCKLDFDDSGSTLKIKAENDNFLGFGRNGKCEAELTIKAPGVFNLEAVSGSGNLEISGLKGDFKFALGSGDLETVNSGSGRIEGQAGSGDVKIAGDLNVVDVKLGSGDLELVAKHAAVDSKIEAKLGSGDAAVSLPADLKIKATLISGSGSISNDLESQNNAAFALTLKFGSGNIAVKKL